MSKACTKEYTLPKLDDQTEPVTICPGTTVQIPVRAIHLYVFSLTLKQISNIFNLIRAFNLFNPQNRDSNFYPDPEVFNPDRFTEEERKNRHKAHYLPFGEGPRMCFGMHFAMAQVKAALMFVIKEFKVTISPNHKPFEMDTRSLLLQSKDGLKLNFEQRS